MWAVFFKEVNLFLNSLIGYAIVIVFLTGIGLMMWVFPNTSVLNYGFAEMETLFMAGPYVFIFLIPAVTMRSFAEEKNTGTLELLLTKPITDFELIFAKFLAGVVLVIIAILPTLIYYVSIYQLGNPVGNIDTAAVIGSYIGFILLGATFTAVGIFASILSANQIVSFVLGMFLCYFLYDGLSGLSALNIWSDGAKLLAKVSLASHYNAMNKGLIDTREIIYFLSLITFFLATTRVILNSRSW